MQKFKDLWLPAGIVVIGAAVAWMLWAGDAGATAVPEPDQCGEEHTYTVSNDSSSYPANVDFINTGSSGNPDSITVTADAGFAITKVEVSVDDDGVPGFTTVATGPVTNLNPSGTTINVAKVTVKKVCPDLCANIAGDQYVVPEGMIVQDGNQCVLPPPPPPVDVCPLVTGVQVVGPCADTLCVPPATWDVEDQLCVTPPPPPPTDVCPLVTGVQESGPCADTLCETPATWNVESQACVPPPPPTDVCPNIEGTQEVAPEGYIIVEGLCLPVPPPPSDVCPNIEGDQETIPEGYIVIEGDCVEDTTPPGPTPEESCVTSGMTWSNGECIRSGGGGLGISYFTYCEDGTYDKPKEWPYCVWKNGLPATTTATTTPPVVVTPPAASCGPLLSTYMGLGKTNNPSEVSILKTFLNGEMGTNLGGDPDFDLLTFNAVKSFQVKYWNEVIAPWAPWGLDVPTGYVFKTTLHKINALSCPTLNAPFPVLP